jgi:DNA polymerase-3 subunit beta
MELSVERDGFAAAVAWAARSLPARPTSAILGGLALRAEAAGGRLTVSGFDYETSASGRAPADVRAGGQVLVSGRLLAQIARMLPHDPVALSVTGSKLVIGCGGFRYSLQGMPLGEYPRLPAQPGVIGEADAESLAVAVSQVGAAAGRDDTLPFLTGVRVEFGTDALRFVATDRYRLAVREIPWRPAADARDVAGTTALVPGRVAQEITRSLADAGTVSLTLGGADRVSGGEGLIGFRTGDRESTTRLLDGEFIKYERIFPSAYSGCAVVETAPLVQAVRAIALVAERTAPLRLAFAPDRVRVSADSGDAADATVALDAVFSGAADADEFTLAANPGYLLDGLNALHAPYAQLSFTTPTKPAVLTGRMTDAARPADPLEPESGYRYLFLPLRQLG